MIKIYAIKYKNVFGYSKTSSLGTDFVKYLLSKKMNIMNDIQIKKGIYGKPYILGIKNLFFNISHDDKWMVCGVSNKCIGIDITKIDSYKKLIVKHYFGQNEKNNIEILRNDLKKEMFNKIWALKESYIKYWGFGLQLDLDSIDFSSAFKYINDNKVFKMNNLYFRCITFEEKYILAICSREELTEILIETVEMI